MVNEAYGLGRSTCFAKRLKLSPSKCLGSLYYRQPTSEPCCAYILSKAARGYCLFSALSSL